MWAGETSKEVETFCLQTKVDSSDQPRPWPLAGLDIREEPSPILKHISSLVPSGTVRELRLRKEEALGTSTTGLNDRQNRYTDR